MCYVRLKRQLRDLIFPAEGREGVGAFLLRLLFTFFFFFLRNTSIVLVRCF